MHTNKIEPLRDEAKRLLQLNIDVLKQMMLAKGVIADAKPGSLRTFDRTSTPKYIEVLQGELVKLENMELVIAVVGTMKAGKSTTINAIVGTEALPTRNTPMTALPTLIRHKPNQTKPILRLENNKPINKLFRDINTCLENELLSKKTIEINADKDMEVLINKIKKNETFKQEYQGADDISSCLKTLSDLVRLSQKLGIVFPFSEYSNINQIPVITVEFSHLREAGKTYGQFSLLDTPGPNEAGQEYFRDMLNEQLQKSSAVLAVVDYGQMKSEAEEDVRKQIHSRTEGCNEFLFVLVNKFDTKTHDGLNKDEVKKYFAKNLMESLIKDEKVFPVSASQAYLANRAKYEVLKHGELPKEPWCDVFLKAAFGVNAKNNASNIDGIKSTATTLWEESGFNDLMEKVISPVHANAKFLAIKSAISQSQTYMDKTTSYLNNHLVFLEKNTNEIDKKIDELRDGLKRIERQKQSIDELMKNAFSTLYKELDSTLTDAKKKLRISTQLLLTNGAYGFNKDKKGMLKSTRHEEIDKILESLRKRINEIIEGELFKLKTNLLETINKTINGIDAEINKTKETVRSISKSFAESDFFINIKVVDLSFNVAVASSPFVNKITSEKETKTYEVDADGVFNAILRFCNSSWGKESKMEEAEIFSVNTEDLMSSINSDIDNTFKKYLLETEKKIMSPLSSEIDLVFNSLKKEFNYISSDFQQGINDKALEKNVQNELRYNLEKLLQIFVDAKPDIEGIASDLDKTGAIV